MSLSAFLYTLSSVPIFAARPFLAAFVTALLARFGPELPWIGDSAMITALHAGPAWFQGPTCVIVLGFWAVLEAVSVRSPEIRQVMESVDGIVKSVVAMLVAFALLDADTASTIGAIQKAGFSLETLWVVVIGGATWLAAGLRRGLVEIVSDTDHDDDLGLQSLLAWVENTWTILGLLFLVIFPLAALVLAAATTLALVLVRRRAEEREERTRLPCERCATPVRAHATRCHVCQHELAAPRAVGVFGQPKKEPARDREQHAFELVARKRCPLCASRLTRRAVQQKCTTCGRMTFATQAEFERYLALITARVPRTMLVMLACGAVPLLGLIPGVIYYRLNLVSGLRGYIPPLRGCTTKWIVRLISCVVIALQPIPLVGALLLPLLCWSTYTIYRHSLSERARVDLDAAHVTA